MKICPYCGKENPDEATVCSVDRTRLGPDVPEEFPRPKSASIVVDLAARPFTVVFAVQLLAADMVFGLVQQIMVYHRYFHRFPNFHYPGYYLPTAGIYGFWALFIYLIYRGKNWARWIASCLIVLGIVATPFAMIGRLGWMFYFNTFLIGVAGIALFQPSSNEWYKGSKKILGEPAPTV
jgi:hypothetical protein